MVEHQLKGLYYNVNKYFPRHNCKENKLFMIVHRNFIVLIDNGVTHNFIHCHINKETHCYIHDVNNFQIIIANGGSMKCGGKCENVKLQMGDYFLKTAHVHH
jgi:hypothetical protein